MKTQYKDKLFKNESDQRAVGQVFHCYKRPQLLVYVSSIGVADAGEVGQFAETNMVAEGVGRGDKLQYLRCFHAPEAGRKPVGGDVWCRRTG
ncbi:hypothetical protein RRU01S_14_00590 [Agrobacterium rubi TR3 = NBRC 13261]|uniref:Uncharacterized protein n=1 Tax=Agrobacterium rubi TR3 = NBRC 13261 TaxID=1368415 RepID=A0A081CVZ2_9HYPH|nr:hypothetical protein RRU01S_14_00590 [Agrobacterium rubi TR3 = NBRC 13261]